MSKLIVANYKMNGDKAFYQNVQNKFNNLKLQDTKIILCPPFVYLPSLKINNKNVKLGAQDISNVNNDKSTGQISANMLNEFNVEYCLVGHLERRALGENLEILKAKILNAIENNIQPIICVDDKVNLKDEIEFLLKNFKNFKPTFAYEPSWAIDGNKVASVDEINFFVKKVKAICKHLNFDCDILYGGGVDLNSYQKIKQANVDGFLLGGICLNVNETISLINEVENE